MAAAAARPPPTQAAAARPLPPGSDGTSGREQHRLAALRGAGSAPRWKRGEAPTARVTPEGTARRHRADVSSQ